MVGSLCGLLAGNTLGAQTLSMLKLVLHERSGVLVFFFKGLTCGKKRRLKLRTSFPLL